jgi:predicted nuclease of predicted toxin-antitoxin system
MRLKLVREERLLLTLDRDFGRLATGSGGHPGAIILRPRDANQAMIMTLALRACALATDIDMKTESPSLTMSGFASDHRLH